MRILGLINGLLFTSAVNAQFAPPVGEEGTTAISKDSSAIVSWASEVVDFERGPEDITNPDGPLASFGEPTEALNMAEGTSTDVVSLGDGGSIVLSFPFSIRNGEGNDFAVFENSFSDDYLELAHVEVSSDGERFVRIPSVSNTPTDEQTGSFGNTDATLIHNLAGKYRQGYGTPFDLEDTADSSGIDIMDIRFVKIIDVVGSIDPESGTVDSEGNLINDPFKTDFESGGFDLDGVGVIHDNNPAAGLMENQKELVLYPNPSHGAFRVRSDVPVKEVNVYNGFGQLIFTVQDKELIDLSALGLAKGVYTVIVKDTDDNEFRSRLVYN